MILSFKKAVILMLPVLVLVGFSILFPENLEAACSEPEVNRGIVTSTIEVSNPGSYRVWSRIKANTSDASYQLEINNSCFTIGGSGSTTSSWSWVDYQNASTEQKTDIELDVGTYTVRMIGLTDNLQIDTLLLIPDALCQPVDFGECADLIELAGDVNSDNIVNVFDLSIILVNWSRADAVKIQGDLNGDGVVNVFDLSMLLMNWGRTL